MKLPQKQPLELLQTSWAQAINPFLSNPLNDVNILKNVQLMSGVNTINHLLARMQQGWFLTDIQAGAQIYRSAPFNDKTLILTCNTTVIVSIGVF